MRRTFSSNEAKRIGQRIGIDFTKIDLKQFRIGLSVELEHGTANRQTNITNDDLEMTGKVAWAHLDEIPDYYRRLSDMEQAAGK